MSKGGDTPLAAKIALWGGREIVGLLIVSLLAGTATIPYIAYHFHWSIDDILDMEHEERHVWLREIARINREINEARRR